MLRRTSDAETIQAWSSPTSSGIWKPMPTNIYTMVPFSWLRCMFFLGSMALYTTDVVRSGLGILDLTRFGPRKANVDTYVTFGPFAYPIQTIRKDHSNQQEQMSYAGYVQDDAARGDQPQKQIDGVSVWPYKLDTLSIGLRALAIELGVKEYPKCLLAADPPCPSESLSLDTGFAMLDGLFEAVKNHLLVESRHVAFAVTHEWIDTIEQRLFGMIRDLLNARYFSLHVYERNATRGTAPVELLNLCACQDPSSNCPSFCSSVKWTTDSSRLDQDSKLTSEIRVADDIAMRFAGFQTTNPELDLQMLILNADNLQWMLNSAAMYYQWDDQEIVVLLRGRKCDSDHQHCEVVLVDDYRYERVTLETNVHEMYGVVACLRSIAQGYVWLRVAMLVVGMWWSTWCETSQDRVTTTRVIQMTCINLLKIPSHVVVYGTLFPVVLHSLAHLIDSYMYHLIVQDAISTTLGKDAFGQFRSGTLYVTLKMRNIWFIALFCTGVVVFNMQYRHHEQWSHRTGIVGFRGIMMPCLSLCTLFFPLRFASLRQVDIRSFALQEQDWHLGPLWALLRPDASPAKTGPFLEARCLLLAVGAFGMMWLCVKVLSIALGFPMPRIMGHSTVVPYSAGTLWPSFALTGYWYTDLVRRRTHRSSVSVSMDSPIIMDSSGRGILFDTPSHVRALRLEKRSDPVWALIRLMNVVMMTNPWEYARLRYFGVPLYRYRLKASSVSSTRSSSHVNPRLMDREVTFLLPEPIDRLYAANQLETAHFFELVQVMHSTSLTWNELIMCG